MRIPGFTPDKGEIAGVRSGSWKLKLAYEGLYPKFLDRLILAGRFGHPAMLFNLEEDPGEQNNLYHLNSEKSEELENLVNTFMAELEPGRATLPVATPKDISDHKQLVFGLLMAAVVVLAPAILVFWVLVRWRRKVRAR
jgi:hypothetical protein